jgi:hypothetical protein
MDCNPKLLPDESRVESAASDGPSWADYSNLGRAVETNPLPGRFPAIPARLSAINEGIVQF